MYHWQAACPQLPQGHAALSAHLAQAVGDGAQVDAAVALPRAPRDLPVGAAHAAPPGAQRVGVRLIRQAAAPQSAAHPCLSLWHDASLQQLSAVGTTIPASTKGQWQNPYRTWPDLASALLCDTRACICCTRPKRRGMPRNNPMLPAPTPDARAPAAWPAEWQCGRAARHVHWREG